MTLPGGADMLFRVAIVGLGPAGFYTAEHLLKRQSPRVEVDIFERLPAPYGLVRFGVAPDHQKIKSSTKAFERIAAHPAVRFYGNVELGSHVTLEELRRHYHAICFATGAESDRPMGIPGEGLRGSHTATEFVAWYNGHPDYRDHQFDLSVERVAVVGVGNVAVDVARILCRLPEELERTDIADYALDALRASRIREVYVLGRRGPAQAAFTTPEVKELGELGGADVTVPLAEVELDPLSRQDVEAADDRALRKKLEILRSFADRPVSGRRRRLVLRFLVSPVEMLDDGRGAVAGIRLVRNELHRSDDGSLRARATSVVEEIPVGLVFRSVGYRGRPLSGVPFDERRGLIPNVAGRVVDSATGDPIPGLYTSGWIKRGPTGVIGTNKPDAGETAESIAEDLAAGGGCRPVAAGADTVDRLVRARQPRCLSFDDWLRLDEIERARGEALGRPRVKFTSVEDVGRALGWR
jgi:ferredoxin--NADP+ reductase